MLDELAAARADTERLAAPLGQAQLDFSSGAGRWSIGEILDHLLLAEKLNRDEIGRLIALKRAGKRPYIRHTFSDLNVAPFFVPNALLPLLDLPFSMLNRVVPNAVREAMMEYPIVPMRNPDAGRPRPGRPAADLRADLPRSLEATRALLVENADIDYRELVSEHPLMGANDVHQIVHFLAKHERRHQGQMEDVRRHRGFPRS